PLAYGDWSTFGQSWGYPKPRAGEGLQAWLTRIYPGTTWRPKGNLGDQITGGIEELGGDFISLAASTLAGFANSVIPGSGDLIDKINAQVQAGLALDE